MKKTTSTFLVLILAIKSMAQVDSSKAVAPASNKSTTFTYYVDVYYKGDFAGKPENNKTSFSCIPPRTPLQCFSSSSRSGILISSEKRKREVREKRKEKR
jgi:hypothetical protein